MAKLKFKVKPTGERKTIFKKQPLVEDASQDIKEENPSATLYDTIDHKSLYRMIYSGVENQNYFNILYEMGIRDFLMSYHYIQSRHINMKDFAEKGIKLFIDSGAFTYQNDPKYAEYTNEMWEKQIVKYLNWAKRNKDAIFAIANLDLENLVGVDVVLEWNRKYFEPFMLETHIPVCFIWHPICEHSGWEYMCQRYPYVGYSWVSDKGQDLDFNFGKKMFDVAKKYNAVVHGMGMTRTSLLQKLPFYTTDSTTWLVGVQYGEVNYWTGQKMTRLKKEKWKGSELPKLAKLGLDEKKLLEEDITELVKANILAFILATEYIHQRLKPRMYWLYPKAKKKSREDKNIFDIFPSSEWLLGETNFENVEHIATELNINPNIEKQEELLDLITDCTLMCCWDLEEYGPIKEDFINDKIINEMHDLYINRVTNTIDDKIEELREFFWQCVEGKEDKLLKWGLISKQKERDSYIEEEEYEYVDVDKSQVLNDIKQLGLLPAPKENEEDIAPEITELDDEIFNQAGYLTVRDDKGRFVKGQKRIRKPKNIYSEKYPKLVCDTCYASQTCPEYKEGYVCAYHKMFKRFDCRNMVDIIEAMQGMVNMNMGRMQRLAIFENLDGGMPDGSLTQMIDQNMRLLSNMKDLYNNSGELMRQTRRVNADGSVEETTSINNQGSGILEQLFAKNVKRNEEEVDRDPNDGVVVEVETTE